MTPSIYPIRWSSLSCFWSDPDTWYREYYLGQKQEPNKYLLFGSLADASFQSDSPLAPVTQLPVKQQKMKASLGSIKLEGTLDGWDPSTKLLLDHKTGKVPWTQTRADLHGQFTMYGLLKHLTEDINPSDITFMIEWIPTVEESDFSIQFKQPIVVHQFITHRSMTDTLMFAARIQKTVREMQDYVDKQATVATIEPMTTDHITSKKIKEVMSYMGTQTYKKYGKEHMSAIGKKGGRPAKKLSTAPVVRKRQ